MEQRVILMLVIVHCAVCFFDPFPTFYSYLPEQCTDYWIPNNVTGLSAVLKNVLYGQHIARRAVTNHIRGHINTAQPSKALVLSFHGWTGTGKNYVTRIIAEHLYRKGMKSKFVHFMSAIKEFPHGGMVSTYKDKIQALIEIAVYNCPQSLFIFDEMDKMLPDVIDIIVPYLESYDHLGGVTYRKAIFIFRSNTAGQAINQYVTQKWRDGVELENLKLVELEPVIASESMNIKTFLWHSDLITKHLITAYIPFLPLRRIHVKECIKDSMVASGYYPDRKYILQTDIDNVMEELTFYPEEEQIFSRSGCKRVAEKVHYVMA